MDLYLPLAGVSLPWPALVAIGLLVGILQGFFGVGGGWLTTPALNILGFPILSAIGTDLAYTCAASVVGSWRHHRLGNLHARFGAVLGVSGILGIEGARRFVWFLEGQGLADRSVRAAYILLLLGVGIGIVAGYARGKRQRSMGGETELRPAAAGGARLAAVALPPMVGLPGTSAAVSLWLLGGVGLAVGAAAGFLGTGGGFIMVPILIYAIGLPARFAVASSLFSIAIANAYGSLAFGLDGKVELAAVALMFAGSILGTQVGATATVHVQGQHLQLLFGLTLMAAGVAVGLRQLDLPAAAAVVMFSTAAGMSGVILGLLIRARQRVSGAGRAGRGQGARP